MEEGVERKTKGCHGSHLSCWSCGLYLCVGRRHIIPVGSFEGSQEAESRHNSEGNNSRNIEKRKKKRRNRVRKVLWDINSIFNNPFYAPFQFVHGEKKKKKKHRGGWKLGFRCEKAVVKNLLYPNSRATILGKKRHLHVNARGKNCNRRNMRFLRTSEEFPTFFRLHSAGSGTICNN